MPTFTYDRKKSFRGWLHTVTVNKYREVLRRRRTPVTNGDSLLEELSATEDLAEFVEEEYRRHVVGRALQMMQAEFQPTTWKACVEHVLSARPAADVARELGISEGAVYVAKHRVIRRLRQELDGLLD